VRFRVPYGLGVREDAYKSPLRVEDWHHYRSVAFFIDVAVRIFLPIPEVIEDATNLLKAFGTSMAVLDINTNFPLTLSRA